MATSKQINSVWVFNGAGGRFPSGVFRTKAAAEKWIRANDLQGILTKYPLDISAYDWCRKRGRLHPKPDDQTLTEFIQQFSSASQEHYHYEHDEDEQPEPKAG